MKVHHYKEIKPVEEIPGVKMHIVAGPDEGARNFIMRVFEIEPNSNTPFHEHSWEHEIFILEGPAAVKSKDGEIPLKPGHAIFIPAGEQHCIVNKGKETVRLICVIPNINNTGSCFSDNDVHK
ncbi:MAG: cupin domain-containing protein [Chloroflexi bacterium]|nr:cupin domain-containing protein [Chloroflexota bacterium]